MLLVVWLLIVETPPSANTPSSPVATILAVVFGICVLLLLSIVGHLLVWLYVRKPKQKETSEAINEAARALSVIYDNSDTFLAGNVQSSALQNIDITTAENIAYATKSEVLGDEKWDFDEDYI